MMLTGDILPPRHFVEHPDLGRAGYHEQPENSPESSHTQPGPKQAALGPFCTMRHLIKEMASQSKMFYGCFYKIQFKLQFIFCGSLQIDGRHFELTPHDTCALQPLSSSLRFRAALASWELELQAVRAPRASLPAPAPPAPNQPQCAAPDLL